MADADTAGELLDILDSSGNPLGIIRPRHEAHHQGLWHRTVHVWIVNDQGELLLQKRAAGKESHPGRWDISAAGHIAAGDSGIVAAMRELKEELGIDAPADTLQFLFDQQQEYHDPSGTFHDREFSDIYLLRRNVRPAELSLQKDEVEKVRLFKIGELKALIKKEPDKFVPHEHEYLRLFERLAL
ncbi:MAG: NUDIX domain-containing protein [Chitinispirillaceae bacterium]|jgi:isopentenyldiphosphate isomerase|nr:NUDIX domain-containing protein [Chitinispirillaceae bacterium]